MWDRSGDVEQVRPSCRMQVDHRLQVARGSITARLGLGCLDQAVDPFEDIVRDVRAAGGAHRRL